MFVVRLTFASLILCAPSLAIGQTAPQARPTVAVPGADLFAGAVVMTAPDGTIRRARHAALELAGADAKARAESFVARYGHRLGLDGAVVESVRLRGERTLVRLRPTHRGVPVLDGGIVLTLRGTQLVALNNEAPRIEHVESKQIDAKRAREIAAEALAAQGIPGAAPKIAKLGIVTLGPVGTPVYEVDWAGLSLDQHWVLRIDAHRGRLVGVDQRGKH